MARVLTLLTISCFTLIFTSIQLLALEPTVERKYSSEANAVLDIYSTSEPQSPIVVFVHGGGWSSGSRKWIQNKPQFFNDLGYTFISIGYPYLPEAEVDDQITAVEKAVAWIKDNANSLGASSENIILTGHSSGAHLAVVAALKLGPDTVQKVIAIDAPMYDLRPLLNMKRRGVTNFFERIFGRNESEFSRKSAHTFISSHKNYADYLFAYSNQNFDGWIVKNVERFVDDLRSSGASNVDVFEGWGYDHMALHRKIGDDDDEFSKVIAEFLVR
ncbi:alpha/beta hydrolase [Alphaproteobacteria bacterium]|nr:alpha/beta hydrolase [Alphaproteobacteria bacterium]